MSFVPDDQQELAEVYDAKQRQKQLLLLGGVLLLFLLIVVFGFLRSA